jgi:hypothetical protein
MTAQAAAIGDPERFPWRFREPEKPPSQPSKMKLLPTFVETIASFRHA